MFEPLGEAGWPGTQHVLGIYFRKAKTAGWVAEAFLKPHLVHDSANPGLFLGFPRSGTDHPNAEGTELSSG